MIRFLVNRLIQMVFVVLGVTLIAFVLQNLIATGPSLARAIIGPRATNAQIQGFIDQYGLNHPIVVQYVHYLGQLVRGNLGYSYKLNEPVRTIIANEFPKDVLLVGTALVLSLIIAVPLGIWQAVRRNKLVDHSVTAVSFLLYSMPSYWLSLLLIAVFAVTWRLLPSEAPQGRTVVAMIEHPDGIVLPILSLTLINLALFSRYMRSAAIETLAQDYIRTATAKGSSMFRLLRRHLLRNSLASVTTIVGLSLPGILTAGVVVENVFNVQGVGLSFFTAASTSDYPVELGITVLVGLVTVIGNLLADIMYAVLDPRVRYD
ncbi:MAG TPA: ABC transporter permease [Mycobacteriales bacterium]|nr:ABC transporter permease [Mycobacteriales bacterium]